MSMLASHPPQLRRDLYAVMGLPFDAVSMRQAVDAVHQAVRTRVRLFISTPNLNFVMAARRDATLRRSVLISDLSLADGVPVVWVSRLLGVPITERVSGSGLFEALQRDPGAPGIKVFFFGGPNGVAELAGAKINQAGGGMRCVGHLSPGFGSLHELSADATIAAINAAAPDFLVVALGAAKGQAWIEHNMAKLDVPVVSHLGAVVNFVAGRVRRAPRWVQHLGAEWLWRIKEEPVLARRYLNDAIGFVPVFVREILPSAVAHARGCSPLRAPWPHCSLEPVHAAPGGQGAPTSVTAAASQPDELLKLLLRAQAEGRTVRVDLDSIEHMNAGVAGHVLQLIAVAHRLAVGLQFDTKRTDTVAQWRDRFALPEISASGGPK